METRVRRGVLFSFQRVKTEFFCVRDFRTVTLNMRQSIQEWTKWNLWKTALKNFTWSILEYFVPFCWSTLKTSYTVTNDTEVSLEYPHYQEFLFDDGETSWLLLSNSNSGTIKRIATACPSSFCSVMLIGVFNFQKCIHHCVLFGNLWFFLRWLASLI